MDVRIEAAPTDHVAARRRRTHGPDTREQRTDQEEGGAHSAAQFFVELVLEHLCGMNLDVVGPDPVSLDSDVVEELDHRLDVDDPGNVV